MAEFLSPSIDYMKRLVKGNFEIRILENGEFRTIWSVIRNNFDDNWDETRKFLAQKNKTSNVFFTLNPLLPACESKTAFGHKFIKVRSGEGISDNEIAEYRWLLIDLDPERNPKDISSSDEEKVAAWGKAQEIKAFLKKEGFLDPVFCDSGNGYHLLYRISLVNTKETTTLLKNVLAGLSQRFSDDVVKVDRKVFNAARIVKFYGTVARKGKNDVANGRTHRPSGIIEFPDMAELKVNTVDLLEKLVIPKEKKENSSSSSGSQEDSVNFVRDFLENHDIAFREEEKHGVFYFYLEDGCVFNEEHKGKDACLIINEEGKRIYKCFHDSCDGMHWKDFVRVFEPDYKTYEERKEAEEAYFAKEFGQQVEDEETESSEKELVQIERNEKGKALANIGNYLKVLREDKLLKGMIGYNVLTDLPQNKRENREWRDSDDATVLCYIESKYHFYKNETYSHALKKVLDENRFSPVKEALDKLKWDGVKRVETSLIDYLGADDTEYVRFISKMMFVAAIARTYKPGCKYDNMPILIGEQGCGKSTFCERMALHPEFFTDSVRGVGDKEAIEQILGSWIVEWGEMSAMRRARDAESLKLFISQCKDKCRKAYSRNTVVIPRMCVFIGTSNDKDGLLTDRTGNRRFFPVEVTRGQKSLWHENVQHEFEQMYAEAKELYKAGFDLKVPKALTEVVAAQQEKFVAEDSRVGLIEHWIESQPELENVCVRQIWDEALEHEGKEPSRQESIELGRILSSFKFLKRKGNVRMPKYGVQKCWQVEKPDWFDV